ncbi:MAG: proprotein convertase P-domain-containing protein, partial [Kofleriaceae bacterium]
TAYAFTVDPSVPCGSQLAFALTVNYSGVGTHPTVIAFSLPTGRLDTVPTTLFSYAGAPVAIPDGDTTGVDIPFVIAATQPIGKLTFSLDGSACSADAGSTTVGLDHTWVGDVSLTLTSPAGTAVSLADRIGGPSNSGNNLCQTVLSDDATTSIETVAVSSAPYTGTFKPNGALSAFSGQNPAGTWVLHATDSVFIDSGSVRAFSIEASSFSCSATP